VGKEKAKRDLYSSLAFGKIFVVEAANFNHAV
jgi:hypothetical protein